MNERTVTDAEIVRLLFERDERALILLSDKYSRLYTDVIRGAVTCESDVQECTNDLLMKIWESIPPNRPDHLAAYVAKLARRIGINRFRHNTRQKRNESCTVILSELEESAQPLATADEPPTDDRLSNLLSDFVRCLDERTRVLFIRRYVYLESVSSLAERYEMNENAISVRLHRARKKLKKLLETEGIEI